jgi:hypothetical protein
VGSVEKQRREREVEIPVNVERTLMRAASDPGFRQLLLSDRASALQELRLTASERAVLEAMPSHLLEPLLDRLDARKRPSRFAVGVAAAVAGTMLLTSSCDVQKRGLDPELPDDTETQTDQDAGVDGGE